MTVVQPKVSVAPEVASSELVLSVQNVSKKFCRNLKRSLVYGLQDIATEVLGMRQSSPTLRSQEFWALDDVSFQVKRGEAVGLVGKNGSGKSTLLRVISGLIKPDTGSVEVRGRVAPLIALGAGFNPILSGRENIYANMSILGLSRSEIDDRYDDVVEFSEIGNAIDAPVQSYSSGMAARLGFACAIHTEPDILIIDEVLAVGDLRFRAKCYRQLSRLRDQGVAFVLVSHSSNSILSKCETAVYLSQGKLIATGDAEEITRRYENDLFLEGTEPAKGELQREAKSAAESSGLDITSVTFRDQQGEQVMTPVSGTWTVIQVGCQLRQALGDINIGLTFREQAGEGDRVLVLSTLHDRISFQLAAGSDQICLELPYLGLKPGGYVLDIHIYQGNYVLLDSVMGFQFAVESLGSMSQCSFYQPRNWKSGAAIE